LWTLRELGMVDKTGMPYAKHSRHLALRPRTRPCPDGGDPIPAAPQIRITLDGLAYVYKRLGGLYPHEVAQAAQDLMAAGFGRSAGRTDQPARETVCPARGASPGVRVRPPRQGVSQRGPPLTRLADLLDLPPTVMRSTYPGPLATRRAHRPLKGHPLSWF